MQARSSRWAAAVVVVVLGGLAAVPAARAADEQRYFVETKAEQAPSLAAEAARSGVRVIHEYERVLHGFAAAMTPDRAAAVAATAGVVSVIPDERSSGATTQPNPPWGLDRIDQRPTTGDASYTYDTTGSGVTAFVIDTGIRMTHTQFGGRVTSGYDFVDDDADASDCFGHGTHVAGTIGGSTYGVAKAVKMISLRVWNCDNFGWQSDIAAALDWVVAHEPSGPSVVNISGGGDVWEPLDQAVANTVGAGIPVVFAAMNNDVDACTISPARAPAALTIGATDDTDTRASFSDWGTCLDLWAPGVDVLSSTVTTNSSSGYMSGTSMATPHVTGIVARYLQDHRTATPAQVEGYLDTNATPSAVQDAESPVTALAYAPPGTVVSPTGPSVTAKSPADGTAGVALTKTVTVTFSKTMAKPATQAAFSLVRTDDGSTVAGTFSWLGRTMTFKPSAPLSGGTPYRYTVTTAATDTTGAALTAPATAAFTTVAPPSAPSAPGGVSATAGLFGRATVKWTAPASDGGSAIKAYTVTASPGGRTASTGPYARQATVTGLTKGTAYTFTVTATNAVGTSLPSAPSNAVTAK